MVDVRLIAYLPVSGLAACLFVALCGTSLLVPAFDDAGLLGLPALAIGVAFILIAFVLGLRWGKSFGALSERDALTALSVSCLIAACESFAFTLIPSPMGLVFLVVILAASSFVPRDVPTARATTPSSIDGRTGALAPGKREAPLEKNPWVRFRGILSRNWVVFGGFLLCVTIQSGAWSDYLFINLINSGSDHLPPYGFLHSELGLLLGALAVLLVARLLKGSTLQTVYLIAPLICVASLVIIWFFGDWILSSGLFSFLPFGFSLAVCGILHVTRLSRELGRGSSPLLVFAPFIAFTLLLFLSWCALFSLIGWAVGSVVDLICMVVFLVAVSAQSIVSAQRRSAIATKAANRPLADICAEVSDGFSLSPRESEVLVYLVQGRSASYIAEQQFVAISTIKTHIQRIFRKTGVHSKQELLDLVYKLDA